MVPKEWSERKLRQRRIDGVNISTVMVIPNSHNAELLNGLVLKEAQLSRVTGYMVKLVEGNGVPLSRILPPPLPRKSCHRLEKCIVCSRVTGNKENT